MGNKLYVGNLPYGVRDADLEQAFAPFGSVTSAKVMMERDTGRSKGFGFVEMGSDAEAQAAINGMNGQSLGGRNVVVNEAVATAAAMAAAVAVGTAAAGVKAAAATAAAGVKAVATAAATPVAATAADAKAVTAAARTATSAAPTAPVRAAGGVRVITAVAARTAAMAAAATTNKHRPRAAFAPSIPKAPQGAFFHLGCGP